MIISASRRTDIPAYFGDKFYNDLISGKFLIINPFNGKKSYLTFKISQIDGIVFWTKNPFPCFKVLKKIKNLNIKFYFQYTLNNYPFSIEPIKLPLIDRIKHLEELHEIIFPEKIILRYDPIILTKNFNLNFHLENFEFILEKTHRLIEKVIISFLTVYRKIEKIFKNQVILNKEYELKLLTKLAKLSMKYSKRLEICCYKEDLTHLNIYKSKCIDASYFGIKGKKHYGQRSLCNCDKSIDVGFYHTCKTGCLYCYAK